MMEPVEVVGPPEELDDAEDWKAEALRPLTGEERDRRLRAMEEAFAFADELLARRGGKPFSVPSAEIIRREREKRTRQIDEAIGGRGKRRGAGTEVAMERKRDDA